VSTTRHSGCLGFLLAVGLAGWVVPGAGHFLIGERKRALIIFVAVSLTFLAGLYVGTIAVVDLHSASAIYIKVAQAMNPPVVFAISAVAGDRQMTVFGQPSEIGQVYTMTSGLLNLLCVVNAVYLGYLRAIGLDRD